MKRSRSRVVLPTLTALALAVVLAGCAAGGPAHSASSASSAPAHSSPSTSAQPSTGSTTDPAQSTTAGGSSTSTPRSVATPGGGAQGTAAGSASTTTCATSQLTGSIGDGGTGAGAAAQRVAIILHNAGPSSCTLQGWPGVSFVGGGHGAQIGNSATLDRSTPHATQTLRPGGEVQAIVVVQSSTKWNSATCEPRVTDGFRVFPPGSRQSLFIPASGSLFEACAASGIHQLSTSALASF